MSEEFKLIKSIQLKESSDHYTIMLIKENDPICQPLPKVITVSIVKILCLFFDIEYHHGWFYGGDQIQIPKRRK